MITIPHRPQATTLLLACIAATSACRGFIANQPGPDPADDPAQVDRDTDTDTDMDVEPDPTEALYDSVWTASLEGSLGTYVTWFAFEPASLAVTQEIQNGWEPENGVMWTSAGTWAAPARGIATLSYDELSMWDDSVNTHWRRWTYAPLTEALSERIYEPWMRRPGEAWSSSALLAQDPSQTHFHGEWTFESEYSGGYVWGEWTVVDVQFTAPIADGQSCSLAVDIEVGERQQDGTDLTASDRFEWGCYAATDPETGLLRISVDGFAGTSDEIRASWRQLIAGRYESALQSNVADSFVPELWVDPARPNVVATVSRRGPLVNRMDEAPPVPNEL